VIDNAENLAYVIEDCRAAVLIVDCLQRWLSLQPHRARMPGLRRVVFLGDVAAPNTDSTVVAAERWLPSAAGSVDRSADSMPPVREGDLAAIVYTSGTTGRPKGVMLSHRNVMSNVRGIMAAIQVLDTDLFLSFLPLSHTLERTVGYYLPMAAGAAVAYARSIPLLMEDLLTIGPTVLVSVPRIYERAWAALREATAHSRIKRRLLDATVRLGWRRFCYAQGRGSRPSFLARIVLSVLDRLVAAPVRHRFGGRLRVAVTGGAPITLDVARPLICLGVPILQGYGMTESSPVISCNSPQDNDPETVGRALPGVAVRIGDNQELLARGDCVMLGYWGRPSETAAAVDTQGWLHTGDQARIEQGRIRIAGRLKDIIVTSTGEKIAPVDLEMALTADPMFDQAMVLGERRPFLTALLVLNPEQWKQEAGGLGLSATDAAQLRTPAALRWAVQRVGHALRGFPSYATPRAVLLTLEPWTLASGLVTPTLKPKRAAIQARYAAQIAELYRGH
jgi:long-chain acyl-CoA synthetase